MAESSVTLSVADARELAIAACRAAGASPAAADSLVEASLSATRFGRSELGFPHLLTYLASFREGRIDGSAEPRIERPLPAVIVADAQGGIAQLGFDRAYGELVKAARAFGIALFTQRNSYTSGELGYYVRRLARDGLTALAATSGPALMAASAGGPRVYCTNPIAFAAPAAPAQDPLVIDQASSATAFINVVRAASRKQEIPEGWATDAQGNITTDAQKALEGALLPFGGYKGANMALMVEMLAAGISGAAWALDAKDYKSGRECPDTGLTVIALAPPAARPGLAERIGAHLRRLRDCGVHIPGWRAGRPAAPEADIVRVEREILDEMRRLAGA